MLSFIYRLLIRTRRRDEVTVDMINTFEEARADAQSRGRWSYFRFAIRELAGVLGSPGRLFPSIRWKLIAGCALTGLALGVAAFYMLPISYTSEAILQITPPTIPGGLLANLDAVDLDTAGLDGPGFDLLRQGVTSRASLTEVIVTYDLYPHQRRRKLLEDVIHEMRKAIRIERSGDFSIRVAFTYGEDDSRGTFDNHKAQKVTQELVSRLLDAAFRNQQNRIFQAAEFFKDRTWEAAKSWDQLNSQVRGLTATDPRFDRLTLDRQMAQREYESMHEKLLEAQGAQELTNRREGRNLQILDAASLPEGLDIPEVMALYGLLGGLAVGIFASVLLALRRVSNGLLAPETAPIH
jgi:hypothetical protein